jgi:hypothetical protein
VEFGNFLGISVDFWSVWSGLGPICNYFSETEGPVVTSPNAQASRISLQQDQGVSCKVHRI